MQRWYITVSSGKMSLCRSAAGNISVFAYCWRMACTCLPTICRSMRIQSSAITRSLGNGWACARKAVLAQVNDALGRAPLALGDAKRSIRRVAWCTGAAQSFFSDAIQAGADLYLSGEVSESTTHLARESGVAYLAAGHHATERYGVQALGQHLADRFGFEHRFID